MKGVDYSKQLAKERNYMQDAVVKNREATDKRVKDLEARAEFIKDKQKENFIEDRTELEQGYQKNLDNVKSKTQAALEAKNANYQKRMEDERKAFKNAHETKSKDFDRRLSDIKESYDRNFKTEVQSNKLSQVTNKDRYNKNIKDLKSTQDQQLGAYQDKMLGAGADLKEQYNREREQLVRTQADYTNDIRLQESEKRSKQNDKLQGEMKLVQSTSNADKDQIQNYTEEKIKRLQNHHSEQADNIARDYTQKADNLATVRAKEAHRSNRESQEGALELKRGFDKELRSIELQRRRRDNGSDDFAEVNNKQMGLKDQDVLNNKIHSLTTALKDTQKEYAVRTNNDQKNFNETLKVESAEATMRKDRAVNDLNADRIITVTHEREKSADAVAGREYINRLDKQASEEQIMHERKMGGERLTNLKENFHKAMTKMEERTKLSIDDVTITSNEDKAKFVKDLNEKRSNEVFELKRDFSQSMDKTVQNYEQLLAGARRENSMLKMSMDQKVQNIMDQTEKKLESEKNIYDERRKSEIQDSQVAMDNREHKLRTEMNTVIVNYQRKLDKMQVDNDTKMKLITNNYENRLKELNALKSKELSGKENTHQIEVQRLKAAFEDEKGRLVSAYENKIAAMTAGHEERLLQLDEFKKLS